MRVHMKANKDLLLIKKENNEYIFCKWFFKSVTTIFRST